MQPHLYLLPCTSMFCCVPKTERRGSGCADRFQTHPSNAKWTVSATTNLYNKTNKFQISGYSPSNLKYCSAFNLHICFCNIDMMICHSIEEHVGSEDFTVLGCDNYPIRVIILPLMRPNWTIMTLPSQGLFQYFPEVSSLAIWHHDAIQNISALLAKPPIFCIDC